MKGSLTRKGEGCIAGTAYVGSLAEAKKVPLTKPVLAGKQEKNMRQSQHFRHFDTNLAKLVRLMVSGSADCGIFP
eukprot:1143707-Pelagomonas_calceolata.AAC.1